jgi:hypothetical protein
MTTKEQKINAKFKEADKLVLAEKAANLRRWGEAIESEEYAHTGGTFNSGNTKAGRFSKGGGGGAAKHRCVWGVLADLRVQDGVGSWSYGGYSDDEQVGQNMPSQQLASFVGLTTDDVVADITREYMKQHMPDYAHKAEYSNVPQAFVGYNDSHSSFGALQKVIRATADDIERRLKEEEAVTA